MRRRSYRTKLEVQVLSGSTAADAYGHTQKTWKKKATVRANVRQLKGDEVTIGSEILAKATHRVEHDYSARAHEKARYKYPGKKRFLNILTADNVEQRNRTTVAICVEERST
jgi:head-tail adaptor